MQNEKWRLNIFILATLIVLPFFGYSQPDDRFAREHFKKTNYLFAIPEYKTLLKVERDNADYNYELALCLLRTFGDRTMAIPYLERACKQTKFPADAKYQLAIAYTYQNEWDKAVASMEEYKTKASGKDKEKAIKMIEQFQSAKAMTAIPINVTFSNINEVNTEYPDYYPFVTTDEKFMYFTTRRPETKTQKQDYDGYYSADSYLSTYDGEKFTFGKNLGNKVNTKYDDQIVGASGTGELLFFYSNAIETYGALYKLINQSGGWKKEKFIETVEGEKTIETAGCINVDENTILFSSNRAGGKGGYDIWMLRKLPNGKWAEPQNLGDGINTAADEDFPSLQSDGVTLFFSSNVHGGMGGYDLFKTTWNQDDNTYSTPQNIGYPLNTPYDERTISFGEDGKHAYISAVRPEGKGDLDIYRVTFNDVEYIPALYQVKLQNTDTSFTTDAVIVITTEGCELVGEYRGNVNNKKFTISLKPGNYNIEIVAEGYAHYVEHLYVNEFAHRLGVIEKVLRLKPE